MTADSSLAAEQHVHNPMMAVLTCKCGEQAVLTGGRFEAFDHNWCALDRYFTIVSIENGLAWPDQKTIKKLASALGINLITN